MGRRVRFDLLMAIGNPVALAAVGAARVHGLSPACLDPAFAFLTASSVLSVAREASLQVRLRRARGRTAESVAWDAPLREPAWSRLSDTTAVLAFGAMAGGAVALGGFAGVGLGICLTIALLGVGSMRMENRLEPRAITLGASGLQVAMQKCQFTIPWSDIGQAEPTAGGDRIVLTILSVDRAVASVEPATPRARRQAAFALLATGSAGRFFVSTWIAGVDAPTMIRALTAAAAGRQPPGAN